jgi:uncharacterized protein (DUF433 family)
LRGLAFHFRRCLTTSRVGGTLDEFLDHFPTVAREAAMAALEEAKFLLLAQPK